MQKSHVGSDLNSTEKLELGLAVLARWEDVAQMRGVTESIWPNGGADGLRPALPRVEELLASALGQIANGSLGDAILEMRVDPTKGKLLVLTVACVAKEGICKSSVVAMVVSDANAMLSGKALEGSFGLDGLLAGQI